MSLYGEYQNIHLTDEKYQNLKDRLKGHTDTMTEKLLRYIKSKGTDYKDHYVTILNWYEFGMNRIKKSYHRKIIKIKAIEPIQPTMKTATAYKKVFFKGLIIKEVSDYG